MQEKKRKHYRLSALGTRTQPANLGMFSSGQTFVVNLKGFRRNKTKLGQICGCFFFPSFGVHVKAGYMLSQCSERECKVIFFLEYSCTNWRWVYCRWPSTVLYCFWYFGWVSIHYDCLYTSGELVGQNYSIMGCGAYGTVLRAYFVQLY